MKNLGFNNRIWLVVIGVMLITSASMFGYRTQTEVMSRGQAMSLLSEFGSLQTENGVLVYTSNMDYMCTYELESLALLSESFEFVYVLGNKQ
jgi:hypothetical protein